METRQSFLFGEELGHSLKLEVHVNDAKRKRLTLLDDRRTQIQASTRTLELLECFLRQPSTIISREDLQTALDLRGNLNSVDTYLSELKTLLKPYDPSKKKIFQTAHGQGVKFLLNVTPEGEYGQIKVFSRWGKDHFYHLIKSLKRDPNPEVIDIRIATTGMLVVDIEDLLEDNLKVQVLFMNDENEALLHARYAARTDKPMDHCVKELREWLTHLEELRARFPKPSGNEKRKSTRGTLEFHLSDIMPCGVLVLAKEWAVLGTFPAHHSYRKAPMLHINRERSMDVVRCGLECEMGRSDKQSPNEGSIIQVTV